MANGILDRCRQAGLRLTAPRREIAAVLEASTDHPDAETIRQRAAVRGFTLSLATIYRTLKAFEEEGILEKRDFDGGRARYEDAERGHHDHLIDLETGRVIEFVDPDIEALQERIAARLGYELHGHKLELYGRRKTRR
ncbi:Fur family transcriptional regulator [Palleronia caenipelagi]|uniref:Ferric uptake regulation protein n=1 Tax=Palleronia caenipelagi TaxID=2489174 RepID=A0A547PLZ5_9RHOB|nr:Fur family transcriptional regulator [Palleronia caenipelagi]TRD15165.1 transcriptional repressor [Palleronia caenipelagi]